MSSFRVLLAGVALAFATSYTTTSSAQTRAWRTVPNAGLPALAYPCVAYHGARGHTIIVGVESGQTGTSVFDFDGSTWSRTTSPSGPQPNGASRCVYDASRSSVFWFSTTFTGGGVIQTWELASTTWSNRTPASANTGGVLYGATYDSSRNAPYVLSSPESYKVSAPTFDWVLAATFASLPQFIRELAYDAGRDVHVTTYLTGGQERIYEWNGGGTWAYAGVVTGASFGASHLVYDANRGSVLGIGASPTTQLFDWTGSGSAFTLASGPSAVASVTYDASRKSVMAFQTSDRTVWELGTYATQGAMCAAGSDCFSGFCVDGRCCNAACGGNVADDCQACSVTSGALTDGTCRVLPNTVTCRPSAGVCDIAEACNGVATTCPSDAFAGSSTTCRPATGACDLPETCTGGTASCTAPDLVADGTVVCRPATGPCDQADSCNGVSKSCPSDSVYSGVVCRSIAGPCDVEELCSGASGACPNDTFAAPGTPCDASQGVCDAVDHCVGGTAVCPEELAVDDTPCDDQNACTQASACKTGVCTETLRLDCSDGDPCTLDTCQDAVGSCSHAPLASCAAMDAGALDASMTPNDAGSNDAAVSADSGGEADAGDEQPVPAAGGCSCRLAQARVTSMPLACVAALALLALRRMSKGRERSRS